MANRHKFKKGGRVVYSGAGSDVAKEAKAGSHGAEEAVERKHGGKVPGHKGKHRFKRGGGVMSNAGGGSASSNPFVGTAHHGK